MNGLGIEAVIHIDHRAGDIASAITSQVQHGRGGVVGLAVGSQG
ncbi:hypothetical protein RBA63_14795 [Brenneria goodwinii]